MVILFFDSETIGVLGLFHVPVDSSQVSVASSHVTVSPLLPSLATVALFLLSLETVIILTILNGFHRHPFPHIGLAVSIEFNQIPSHFFHFQFEQRHAVFFVILAIRNRRQVRKNTVKLGSETRLFRPRGYFGRCE